MKMYANVTKIEIRITIHPSSTVFILSHIQEIIDFQSGVDIDTDTFKAGRILTLVVVIILWI